MGVEAAVGPHRELTLGPGVAHPAQRLPQEMSRSPGGIGPALPETGHQHLTGAGSHGQQRVIAPLAGVAVMAGALLAQTISLADSGINIDGQGPVAGSGPSGPGPGQQFPAHPVQLPHVPPAEAAQEGAQGGGRLDHTPQDAGRTASTQHVGVVDAVAAGQGGGHQGQQLVSGVGPARGAAQIQIPVSQFTQTQVEGQRCRKHQPGVGYQTGIVKGDTYAVGMITW